MSRFVRAVNVLFKDGKRLVEYRRGDEVTDPAHIDRLDGLGALESPGGDDSAEERLERALGLDSGTTLQEAAARLDPEPSPTGGTPDDDPDPIAGDYASRTAQELHVEAQRRGLTVTGSGAGGNVLKDDLVKALEADDAEQD